MSVLLCLSDKTSHLNAASFYSVLWMAGIQLSREGAMSLAAHGSFCRYSQDCLPAVAQAAGFGLGEGLAAGKIAPAPLLFKSGQRFTVEGGTDVPSGWAQTR